MVGYGSAASLERLFLDRRLDDCVREASFYIEPLREAEPWFHWHRSCCTDHVATFAVSPTSSTSQGQPLSQGWMANPQPGLADCRTAAQVKTISKSVSVQKIDSPSRFIASCFIQGSRKKDGEANWTMVVI